MARGPAVKIILGANERSELEMRARRRKIARVDAVRAEIVLLAADGMNNCAIAATLGVSRLTVGLWRKRFAKKRFDGLDDEPRRLGGSMTMMIRGIAAWLFDRPLDVEPQ